MAEHKITITIHEDGSFQASTEGLKGEMCLEELEALLDNLEDVKSVKKTDEFYQTEQKKTNTQLKNKKS